MLVSRTTTIEMGHRVPNHTGKCWRVHGHSYTFTVYAEAGWNADDAVERMAQAVVVNGFDHMLCLWMDDPFIEVTEHYKRILRSEKLASINLVIPHFGEVVLVKEPPTVEYMAALWLRMMRSWWNIHVHGMISAASPSGVSITKIQVSETKSSRVEAV